MRVLFPQLPIFPWWGSGTPAYENNWAMKVGKIPDQQLVKKEYKGILQTLQTHASLDIIPFPPSLDANGLNKHDFIFLRDSFISNQKGKIVLSHFAEKERQPEVNEIEKYLVGKNFTFHTLSEYAYAEGGEFYYCPKDNFLFSGISRNNKKGIEETANYLGTKDIFIVESESFHLDTIFTIILNSAGKLIGMMACLELIKNASELKEFAKERNLKLISINSNDTIDFDGNGKIAVNCLPAPGKLIGGSSFTTNGVEETLKKMNILHAVSPITQFLYSGGGVHCLTNELFYS